MAIDRADWHYGADDFPSELRPENGGTHIGMLLAWAILNNLASRELVEDWPDEITAVRSRQMTGCAFLFKACDEKFWETDLNDEGNAFVAWYYSRPDGTMPYVDDYANALAEDLATVHHVADTWENYDKIAPIISNVCRMEIVSRAIVVERRLTQTLSAGNRTTPPSSADPPLR